MDRSCVFLNQIMSHHSSENRTVNNSSILPKIMQSINNNSNNSNNNGETNSGIIRLEIRPLTLIEKENYQRQLLNNRSNTTNKPESLTDCFEENISDSLEKVQKYHQLLSQKLEAEIHQERLETVSSFVKALLQRKKDSEIVSHCFDILKKTKDEFETLKNWIAENERIKLANRSLVDKGVQCTKQEEDIDENNQDVIRPFFSQKWSCQEVQTIPISGTKDYEKTGEKQEIEDDDEEEAETTSINTIPESQPIQNLQVVYVSPNDDFVLDETLKSGKKRFSTQNNDYKIEFCNPDQSKSTRHVQFDTENIIPILPSPSDNVNDNSSSCPPLISPTHPTHRVPLNTTSINIPPIYQEVPADILKNSLVKVLTEPSLIKIESSLSSSSTTSSIISKYTNYISPQKGPIFSGKLSNKQNLKKIYGQNFIGIQAGVTTSNSYHSPSSGIATPSNDSLPFKISKNIKTSPKVLSNSADDFTPLEIPLQIKSKFRPPFMQNLNLVPLQNGNQGFHPTVSTIQKKTKRKHRLTSIAKLSPRVEVGQNGRPLVQTVLKFSFKSPFTSDVDTKNDTDEYKNGNGENKDSESEDFVS